MTEHQGSYRQVMKATSLFGGVQVFNIIISIIRSKFIAILLGPTGMGIAGLLTSTISLIGSITNFGLGTSAVKSVSAANASGDSKRIATIITILRRLVWITGLLGTIITIVFSSWLSELTFGNKDYTIAFVWISITLLLAQLSSGQLVLLQGMRKLQYLAKANMAGSFLGLLISVPIYYMWGVKGIVPTIIFSSVSSLTLSWFFASKVKIPKVNIDFAILKTEGSDMLKLGLILSLNGLMALGASYIVRIFISRHGGIEQVGLYTAGFAIINTYVGMIFSAMITDYFPRLAAVSHSNELSKRTINQQAEIALLILAPIVMIFLVFIYWVVILLYSKKFIAVDDMIHWAAMGMFFKAASWSMGVSFVARGAYKLLFWNELISSVYILGLNILGYHLFGLTGLGISFLIAYMLHFLQIFIVCYVKYNFNFYRDFNRLFIIQLMLAVTCFVVVKMVHAPYSYIFGCTLIVISTFVSYRELDKRLNIKQLFRKVISRNKN